MPLTCQSPEGLEYAYRHDAESWARLRSKNATQRHLYMPCCQAAVVLKRSSHGTLFFAHARRNGCTTAPESAIHLLVKDLIARTAERLGFAAHTECAGRSTNGDSWIADVLCHSTQSSAAIAFEVQWSRQDTAMTMARSDTYRRSGVIPYWLMRQPDLPISNSAPAFLLTVNPVAGLLTVSLPSRFYRSPQRPRAYKVCARDWAQTVTLSHFVSCALHGRIRFSPVTDARIPLNVDAADVRCWQCGGTTTIVTGLQFEADPLFPGFGNHTMDLRLAGAAGPKADTWLTDCLPDDVLAKVGIGPVRRRLDRVTGESYVSNGCLHCGALQYDFYTGPTRGFSRQALRREVLVESWIAHLCSNWANRWWLPAA